MILKAKKMGDGLILLPILVLCPCCILYLHPTTFQILSQLHSMYFDFLNGLAARLEDVHLS
jgi:hypothetical protein